jgi:glycosyltransferase involved in cell wall biosynthesis
MKILMTCGSYSWGGLEMQAVQMAEQLQSRHHSVMFLCPPNTSLYKEAVLKRIPVQTEEFKGGRNIIGTIKKIAQLIQREKFEIIHTHLSHDLWLLVPALHFARSHAKLFLTKNMASGVSKKDLLHRLLYRRVTGIFAVSNYIRQSVAATCPVPDNRIHIIPNGIPFEKFSKSAVTREEVRKELGIPTDMLVVGIIGRMSPGKGHEEFLRAAAQLKSRYEHSVLFAVIGGPSYREEQYAESLLKLSEGLGLGNFIRFIGFRSDIPRILAAIDILAFPSHEESFGITVVEAMAMEVPVVASGNAGVVDIVVDNETGISIPPKSFMALADGIERLIKNPELRIHFGIAGRKRAEIYFSFTTVIQKLEQFYSGSGV